MSTNKVALVTGAAKGIGRAIATRLAADGYTVIVNYNGSADAAAQTVNDIEQAGGTATAIRCDVSSEEDCNQMIADILAQFGRVDVLVNNAGITKDNLLMKMSDEEFTKVVDINLLGAFHTIRGLSRSFLKQRSGRIINISSVSGIAGNAGQSNYSASKAGLIGLTKSVARELASRGITANAVAPGMIETDMTKDLPERVREEMQNSIPLKRIGEPDDIANAVAFLASEQAAYITGQVLVVDGGMTM